MVEFIGLIKVNVVRGTNLAVRDVVTSDPYVIISLGSQVNAISSSKNSHPEKGLMIYLDHAIKIVILNYFWLQSVKTRVIKNNLNPVWNEKLMLSIPENVPPLKVVCIFICVIY